MTQQEQVLSRTAAAWAGVALVLGGGITLGSALLPGPSLALLPGVLPALLVLIGTVLLIAPNGGVTRGSRFGAAALVAFGAGPVLSQVLGDVALLPPGTGLLVGMTLIWLTAVAGVGAAIVVQRAGAATGLARWVLWLPACAFFLCALMETVPLGDATRVLAAWDVGLLVPASFVVAGIAFIGSGRWTALRRRATEIDTAWRESTSVGAVEEPAPRS